MAGPRSAIEAEGGPPRLTWTTIRRTATVGRLYLGIGTSLSLILTLVLVLGSRHSRAFETVFPLELPLFAVMGSMGGLMTFTSDRTKGVFEYLIAYGVRPRTLFADGLYSTAAMSALILGLSLTVGLGTAAATGVPLPWDLWTSIALYTIPMGFAGALFTSTVGMLWSSISTPRAGMNSPVGLAPMVGIAPVILVLIVAESVPPSDFYTVTVGAAVVLVLAVVGLLTMSARVLGRERFLSPL
jgi:hypothetical protein